MAVLAIPIAASSSSTTAVFGFVGVLLGGVIARAFSLWIANQARKSTERVANQALEVTDRVAEQAREAAERAWIRDSRREIYDRFLTCGETLLIACEAAHDDTQRSETEGVEASVDAAHTAFFGAYGMVLTVADTELVDAARVYAYRLWELKSMLDSTSVMDSENFESVDKLVRPARHDTVDAMRTELGVAGSARPEETTKKYNPFVGTKLEQKYDDGDRSRPGSAV